MPGVCPGLAAFKLCREPFQHCVFASSYRFVLPVLLKLHTSPRSSDQVVSLVAPIPTRLPYDLVATSLSPLTMSRQAPPPPPPPHPSAPSASSMHVPPRRGDLDEDMSDVDLGAELDVRSRTLNCSRVSYGARCLVCLEGAPAMHA
jgi:hypothetical protein